MAEEEKKAEEKKDSCGCSGGGIKTFGKMLIGAVLIFLGVVLGIRWLWELKILIKACLGPLLVLVGLIFIAIAKE